ncbi:MAG TPA: hypothetical protein EYP98_20800, partial [Planctomycetes bacterium]|nr:hypothetical protein [Planctomycetota bacterium]
MTLRLKDRELRDVVQSIRRKTGANIIMDPDIEAPVTIDLQDVHWRQALSLVAEQAGCIVTEREGGVLKVEKPPRVYFAFENTDIQKVIDTISKISGANIVVAPEVKGTITVRLKNVPWRHALDAVVKTLGFVVVQADFGILRVVPAANIEQDLVTKTIPLRYVRPRSVFLPIITSDYIQDLRNVQPLQKGESSFTLLDTLRNMITPDIGSLEYISETNVLMIKDTRPVVETIERTIAMMDIEPAQVQLDVRFVTTTNDDLLDIGISPGGSGWSASLGLGQIPTRLPFDLGVGGWEELEEHEHDRWQKHRCGPDCVSPCLIARCRESDGFWTWCPNCDVLCSGWFEEWSDEPHEEGVLMEEPEPRTELTSNGLWP